MAEHAVGAWRAGQSWLSGLGDSASLGLAHQGGRKGSLLRQGRLWAKLGVHISEPQERQVALNTGSTQGSISTLPQDLHPDDVISVQPH